MEKEARKKLAKIWLIILSACVGGIIIYGLITVPLARAMFVIIIILLATIWAVSELDT